MSANPSLPDVNTTSIGEEKEVDKQEAIKARMAKLGRPSIGMVPANRLSKDDPASALSSTLDQITHSKESEVSNSTPNPQPVHVAPTVTTPVVEPQPHVQQPTPIVTSPQQVSSPPIVSQVPITNPVVNPTLTPSTQVPYLQMQQQPFQPITSVNSGSYNPYGIGINQLQMPMGMGMNMNPMNMGMSIPPSVITILTLFLFLGSIWTISLPK